MAHGPCDDSDSAGSETLPFRPKGDGNVIGQEIASYYYWITDISTIVLVEYTHLAEWVVIVSLHMADFTRRAQLMVESRSGICQYLQDTYIFVRESMVSDSNVNTTLHGMMVDYAVAWYPYKIEVRH